jgi:hypothetical protein
MSNRKRIITRRQFIKQGAHDAGILAMGGATIAASARLGFAASAGKDANPFAYDVSRLRKTDPNLIRYEQVGQFRSPYPEPHRIAAGPDNRVYIAAGNCVSVMDRDGGRLSEIALPGPTRCVAVAGDGTVYAGLRDYIEVFDRKGQRVAAWESLGKKGWLTGLAVGEKDLFAADAGNRVILRYDRSGKLVGRIGEKNKDRHVPGLIVPSPYLDVKLAHDGLLRVNNPGRHRVEAYTIDGDLEFFWGKPSAAIEGFCGCCNPVGLALLPDDRYVTAEKGLPRVKIYSKEGAFECVVAGTESFSENWQKCSPSDCTTGGLDAAVDSGGRIYVLDVVESNVRIMARKKDVSAVSGASSGVQG